VKTKFSNAFLRECKGDFSIKRMFLTTKEVNLHLHLDQLEVTSVLVITVLSLLELMTYSYLKSPKMVFTLHIQA
jgi:hypothetical protein